MLPVIDPPAAQTSAPPSDGGGRDWVPRRVLVTRSAAEHDHTHRILERLQPHGIEVEYLKADRLPKLKTSDDRATYRTSKQTLAIVVAPPSQFKLQPIPPSADYQFHLAQGCPAHCQYCYLAGSLTGAPSIRAYANLDDILDNLTNYAGDGHKTFEVSCYTDPLGVEAITGSLSRCIEWFGDHGPQHDISLRWVTKFDRVGPLIGLDHARATRCRFSLNADAATGKMEGGTASATNRLKAAARLASDGYPIGLVIAPIMPLDDQGGERWRHEYGRLMDQITQHLGHVDDLNIELITHRFTPKSRDVLLSWYPKTKLDLSETNRQIKRNKFGGTKYVYHKTTMSQMKTWFEQTIADQLPRARILYWT